MHLLHLEEGYTVPPEEIVAILPTPKAGAVKSCLLLADGKTVSSTIASTTLYKRLSSGKHPPWAGKSGAL